MEFQFDLVWLDHLDAAARLQDLAESLVAEPVVMINALAEPMTHCSLNTFSILEVPCSKYAPYETHCS